MTINRLSTRTCGEYNKYLIAPLKENTVLKTLMLHHNAFRELGGVTIAKGLRKKSKHCLYPCTSKHFLHMPLKLVCSSPVLNQLDKMKEMFDSVERFAGGPRSGLESLEKKWRQSAGGRTGCKRSACTYRSQLNILCCH